MMATILDTHVRKFQNNFNGGPIQNNGENSGLNSNQKVPLIPVIGRFEDSHIL